MYAVKPWGGTTISENVRVMKRFNMGLSTVTIHVTKFYTMENTLRYINGHATYRNTYIITL